MSNEYTFLKIAKLKTEYIFFNFETVFESVAEIDFRSIEHLRPKKNLFEDTKLKKEYSITSE